MLISPYDKSGVQMTLEELIIIQAGQNVMQNQTARISMQDNSEAFLIDFRLD